MTKFDGIPKVESEHRDEISHHPEWMGLQKKVSNPEDLRDGSLLELHRRFHI